MNILYTKDGQLIPSHLNHTLKSYYYNTDTLIFCIDETGRIIDAFPEQLDCITSFCSNHHKEIIALIKEELHCDAYFNKITLTYTYKDHFNFLISPIFHQKTFKGALIAGPICHSQEDYTAAKRAATLQNDTLAQSLIQHVIIKLPPKSFYMSQLLHHLLEKSIYIGPNTSKGIHYISKENMKHHVSKTSASIAVYKIVQAILDGKLELAMAIYKNNLMLGDFFLDNQQDNINNLKSEILTLTALVSHELTTLGCDINTIVRIKSMFNQRILNTTRYQCLFNCGEEVIQIFGSLLERNFYIGKTKPIKETIIFIQHNFKDKLTLDDISGNVYLSKPYLSALFKEETNMTIIDYLKTCRINNSKYLLLNSNLSMLEIAFDSGFESQTYFSSVFKAMVHQTPKQFRQNKTQQNSVWM